MTATPLVAEDDGSYDGSLDVPVLGGAPFVDALVARLHAEYGVDRAHVRHLANEQLATFASARVQTFVPILVEKRLRQICRAIG